MANLDQMALVSALDGVLAVDKPAGIASHDVMREVKRRFNLVKAGHGGTLPGNVSGLFLVMVGDGTRASDFFMRADSAYEGAIRLGRVTDTADREGRTLAEKDFASVTRESLDAVLPELRGDVFLAEPEYQAVMLPGRESYEIIGPKEGDPRPQPKLAHVYRFEVTAFEPPIVRFSAVVAKGTSMRALAANLGELLGCGASLESLRRTRQGKVDVSEAITFAKLLTSDSSVLLGRVVKPSELLSR